MKAEVWTRNLRDGSNPFAIPWMHLRKHGKGISDDTWMEMLNVRNELTRDYDGDIVKSYCTNIVEKYIDLFYAFEETVKQKVI